MSQFVNFLPLLSYGLNRVEFYLYYNLKLLSSMDCTLVHLTDNEEI